MKESREHTIKVIKKLILSEGHSEEYAEKEAIKRADKIYDFISSLGNISPYIPLFNEESCRCLNCGRLLLAGKCCTSPRYIEDTERYADKEIKSTETDKVFSVFIYNKNYFVIEEKPGVYSNTLYHTEQQAAQNIK